MRIDDSLVFGMVLAAALQGLAHWFPWNKFLGRHLYPPFTYVVGILFLAIPMAAIHILDNRDLQAALDVALIVCAGGGMVLLAYLIDWLLEVKHQRDDWRDRAAWDDQKTNT